MVRDGAPARGSETLEPNGSTRIAAPDLRGSTRMALLYSIDAAGREPAHILVEITAHGDRFLAFVGANFTV